MADPQIKLPPGATLVQDDSGGMQLPPGATLATETNPTTGITVPQGMIGETPGYFKEIMGGLGRGIAGVGSFVKQSLTPHDTLEATRAEEVKMGPVGRLLYNIPADIGQSLLEAEKARVQSQRSGEGAAGQTLTFLENSPVGGLVRKAEEAGPGYAKFEPATAGAVTEAGTMYAAPKVVSKLVGTPAEAKSRLQPFLRKASGAEAALEGEAVKAADKFGKDVAENKAKRTGIMKENLETQRAARMKIDQDKVLLAEKNRGIEAENKTAAEKVAKRGDLTKAVDEQSVKVKQAVEGVERKVYEEGNKKFEAVRAKIPGDAQVSPEPLVATVRNVEKNVLQNIPENIKEFRSILKSAPIEEGLQGFAESHGLEPIGPEPVTWDKLQSLKSRLDARLRSRSPMNGDLKRGLYETRDAVVDNMGKLADSHGATGEWAEARNFWRQYKEDFGESTGPAGSASPVAQSLNAVDPANIRQPFLRTQSTLGNRGVDILKKYPQFGGTAAATAIEQLVNTHKSMTELPKKATPTPLGTPKEAVQLPENKTLPKRPEAPTVDAHKVALQAIAQRAKNIGTFNARDVGIMASSVIAGPIIKAIAGKVGEGASSLLPQAAITYEGGKYAASRLLRNPAVAEWLSRTPPEEAAALKAMLKSIPGGDQVKVLNLLTDEAKAAAKGGTAVQLSREAKDILGSARVAAIVAAGGANANQVNNRKDALDLLGQPPNQP